MCRISCGWEVNQDDSSRDYDANYDDCRDSGSGLQDYGMTERCTKCVERKLRRMIRGRDLEIARLKNEKNEMHKALVDEKSKRMALEAALEGKKDAG